MYQGLDPALVDFVDFSPGFLIHALQTHGAQIGIQMLRFGRAGYDGCNLGMIEYPAKGDRREISDAREQRF